MSNEMKAIDTTVKVFIQETMNGFAVGIQEPDVGEVVLADDLGLLPGKEKNYYINEAIDVLELMILRLKEMKKRKAESDQLVYVNYTFNKIKVKDE